MLKSAVSYIINETTKTKTGEIAFPKLQNNLHQPACKALVFMADGIMYRWKHVIAYNFTDESCNGAQLLHLTLVDQIKGFGSLWVLVLLNIVILKINFAIKYQFQLALLLEEKYLLYQMRVIYIQISNRVSVLTNSFVYLQSLQKIWSHFGCSLSIQEKMIC